MVDHRFNDGRNARAPALTHNDTDRQTVFTEPALHLVQLDLRLVETQRDNQTLFEIEDFVEILDREARVVLKPKEPPS
jgi:hypothetical protein